jgi:hypothetical protein
VVGVVEAGDDLEVFSYLQKSSIATPIGRYASVFLVVFNMYRWCINTSPVFYLALMPQAPTGSPNTRMPQSDFCRFTTIGRLLLRNSFRASEPKRVLPSLAKSR